MISYTPTELNVLRHLPLPSKEIAQRLGYKSSGCIDVLVCNRIFSKLQVQTRTAALAQALKLGLISLDELVLS